jgi:hypothetical protein
VITEETKKEKNAPPSLAEAIILDPGVPDSISDTLLFAGAGPLSLIVNGTAASIALLSSLAKRFKPGFLKKIPIIDKAFHNMRTTLHCDTAVNVFASAVAAASGQWLIAATGFAGAYSNIPELEGIRHKDDKAYMENTSLMSLLLKRKDFWLGLNYGLATLLVSGLSVTSFITLPILALATVVGIKNAKNHLPERTNHPKMLVAAAFLAAGIPAFFTGIGGIAMGLSTVIAAVSFVANEVHVTPGGLKQVIKDCLTLDNYKYGFIPFAKSGFGLKKFIDNPKLIGTAARNAAVRIGGMTKNAGRGLKKGFSKESIAQRLKAVKNIFHSKKLDVEDADVADIGDVTPDGIYIGRMKDTNGVEKDYFAAPEDAKDPEGRRLTLNFNEAAAYADAAVILGHDDWMIPTSSPDRHENDDTPAPDVLRALFNSRNTGALKGTFEDEAWYWSATTKPPAEEDQDAAKIRHFDKHGRCSYGYKKDTLPLRLVREKNVVSASL